jgi:DNA ligase-1
MQLCDIVTTSRSVRETSARSDKIRHLAACLRRLGPDEIETAVALLSGGPRQGRIGLGPATLHAAMPPDAAPAPELTLAEVDATLGRIAQTSGAGSAAGRARLVGELFARATRDEQDFLLCALLGELRQGAVEGLMAEAVAQAAELPIWRESVVRNGIRRSPGRRDGRTHRGRQALAPSRSGCFSL